MPALPESPADNFHLELSRLPFREHLRLADRQAFSAVGGTGARLNREDLCKLGGSLPLQSLQADGAGVELGSEKAPQFSDVRGDNKLENLRLTLL
jgi:hypothetical protein